MFCILTVVIFRVFIVTFVNLFFIVTALRVKVFIVTVVNVHTWVDPKFSGLVPPSAQQLC